VNVAGASGIREVFMQPSVRRASLALVIALFVGACGAASTPSPSGGAQSASAPAASEPASAPASGETPSDGQSAPAGSTGTGGGGTGSETVRVVLTGGPDAGTYTTDADPLCTNGVIGENGWGVQYSTADLTGDKDFTSLQLVYYPDGPPGGEAMFGDTPLLVTITIGALLEGGRTYEIIDNAADDTQSKGEGTATVGEGDPTVIEVSGTTDDDVQIEATITCPNVTRV
jgi:hypothetical protein